MGASLPFCLAALPGGAGQAGRAVGGVYLANTLGAVLGAFATGYLAIPLLGLGLTLQLLLGLQAACGVALLLSRPRPLRLAGAVAALAVALPAVLRLPEWSPRLTDSLPYLHARQHVRAARERGLSLRDYLAGNDELLDHREDLLGSVSVIRSGGRVGMRISGKVNAAEGDLPTLRLAAHLPLALRPGAQDALVIGLATGATLRSVALHGVARIECVEISPGVIRAARHPEIRRAFHRGALDRRGVRILQQDGRTHLELAGRSWDVIVSQPPNLWIDGVPALFTREFYEHARRRLAPGGVFAQWIHAYLSSEEVFTSCLATFAAAFEHVQVWETIPGIDYLLVGSREPLRLDDAGLWKSPAIREELLECGVTDRPRLLAAFLGGGPDLAPLLARARRHDDATNFVGYRAPLDLFRPGSTLELRLRFPASPDLARLLREPLSPAERAAVLERRRARLLAVEGSQLLRARKFTEGMDRLVQARAADPDLPLVRLDLKLGAALHFRRATRARQAESWPTAEGEYRRAALLDPDLWEAHYNLGKILALRGVLGEALETLERARRLQPRDSRVLNNLAVVLIKAGRGPEAIPLLEDVLSREPDNRLALDHLSRIYLFAGRMADGKRLLERLVALDPANRGARELLERLK